MVILTSTDNLVVRYEVVVEFRGERVIDDYVAVLLKTLRDTGSILAASKSLGVPYSRFWETVTRVERITGRRVVEGRRGGRGGGGARLTDFGEELLTLHSLARSRLESLGLIGVSHHVSVKPDLTIAHSHDPVLASLLSTLSKSGVGVNSLCLGSGLSLAMLSLKAADVACIHLYDPESKTYNKPYMERFWLGDDVVLVGGFMREVVLVHRRDLKLASLEEGISEILRGRLKVAFRNKGSGTRAYLEHLLKEHSKRLGLNLSNVKGMGRELRTHEEVAKYIVANKADVGLTLRHVAEKHELRWIHVTWEPYECYALKDRASSSGVAKLREHMNSETSRSVLIATPGYKPLWTPQSRKT